MRDKVLRFVEERGLIDEGDMILVALSGGADSVTLLHVLNSFKESYKIELSAIHFNHMIRGEEADSDERFTRELCAELGVRLFAERADVPQIASKTGESLELCGRRLRYEAFERVADELGGAKIATAHTMSDNSETVLMNLTRGSGLSGLGGIPVVRGRIIRPLLCCTGEEVREYCANNSLRYVTDSTNLEELYTRNRFRLRVLPVLRELNPSLDDSVARMSAVAREVDDYLNHISIEESNAYLTDRGHLCKGLLEQEHVILSYALKNILTSAGAPYDFRHIELIISAMADGGAVDLGEGYRAECAQGYLRIIRDADDGGNDLCVPLGEYARRVSFDELSSDAEKVNKKFLQNCIPCDIITDDAVVRYRRAGDSFSDPRRGVTKSLKKLLNELKIPRERRDSLLVAAQGSTVLWLQGLGTSKQAQIPGDYRGDVYVIDIL